MAISFIRLSVMFSECGSDGQNDYCDFCWRWTEGEYRLLGVPHQFGDQWNVLKPVCFLSPMVSCHIGSFMIHHVTVASSGNPITVLNHFILNNIFTCPFFPRDSKSIITKKLNQCCIKTLCLIDSGQGSKIVSLGQLSKKCCPPNKLRPRPLCRLGIII